MADTGAEAAIRSACAAAGFEVARVEPMTGGLSLRHFARVHTTSAEVPTLVARVEAPEDPAGRPAGSAPEPSHEPIRALLETHGLPVPHRLGHDAAAGVELLEDLGDRDLARVAREADAAERRSLYTEACAWLPRLQRIAPAPGVAAFERRLDAELIAYKGELFATHGLAARGRATSPAEADCVMRAFARIAEALDEAPRRLSHRDYQSANLLVTPGPPGARLRWVDLQGALLAPPEYDLVCLLRDSYVELPADEIASLAESVRAALPDEPDVESFWRRFDWLTLTRKGKDYARFVYAARVRGDRRFLAHLPATARHLRAAAQAAAARDPWLESLGELVTGLPEEPPGTQETPCEP